MPSILGANTLSSGFDVANSARFNDGDSAYMNLTSVNTVTNRLKFTISLWVKRSTLGAKSMIGTVGGDNSNFGAIWFDSNDKLNCTEGSGGGELNFITNRVFRDVSAWYHIVLAIDTTQGTESNRGIFTGTFGLSSGKWYWEIKTSASAGTHASDEWNFIGVSNLPASNTDNILASSGTNSNKLYEYAIHGYDGDFYNNASDETYGASFTTGDIIGVFLDLDNNRIYWSKNGLWADGSGNSDEADPNGFKSVTDPASTIGGFYFPACGDGGSNVNKTWQWNFGGTPGFAISSGNNDPNGYGNFEYPTEGAYAICSKNLAEYGG